MADSHKPHSDNPHTPDGWGNRVAGRCPACGSNGTLFVAMGQHITCSLIGCPDPCLVADFLSTRKGPDLHVVEFADDNWHLEHTMRCRLAGLSDCLIHKALARLDERPVDFDGRYEVEMVSGQLFYRLGGAS